MKRMTENTVAPSVYTANHSSFSSAAVRANWRVIFRLAGG